MASYNCNEIWKYHSQASCQCAWEDGLGSFDLSVRTFSGSNALAKADQTADFLNNEIGRKIGRENPNASEQELALLTLENQYQTGLYVAVKTDEGYRVEQRRISEEAYGKAKEEIHMRNDNGFTQEEQKEIDESRTAASETAADDE